jgi:glycerophosphoryl diester phosphodiesterase
VPPAVIGHRGAAARAPENTVAAFRAAAAAGVGWVEFDVRLSRDARPVVIHDATLERTTDGRGRVADHDAAALGRLDAGSWFDVRFRGERLPGLGEAIAALGALGLGANIELKADRDREAALAAAVVAEVRTAWPVTLAPPLLSSFDMAVLAAARDLAPELPRALCVSAIPADWRARLDAVGAVAMHAAVRRLDRARTEAVIAAGVPLRVYTVNDGGRARRLLARGIAGVFTDDPKSVVAAVRRHA